MDIHQWLKETFTIDSVPRWVCPTCDRGELASDQSKFLYDETSLSRKWRKDGEWEPDWVRYRFAGLLICSNKDCNECVSFSGEGQVVESGYYEYDDNDQNTGQYTREYFTTFTPHIFSPPLNIFTISKNCPVNIRKEITAAFGFFWNDIYACANRVRITLEVLMTEQGVKRFVNKNGKRNSLALHNRLELYKKIQPEVADHLLAIKWIGNSGSHAGKIEKGDLIDAFELLEYSINKLYDGTEKRINDLAKKINKAKGPLPKKSPF